GCGTGAGTEVRYSFLDRAGTHGPLRRVERLSIHSMVRAGVAGPLVGREAELQLLWEQVPASAETGLRVAVVRGPAGIGKSRLLEAFADRAREFGASVMAGRSPAVGSLPYGAVADALSAYARSSVGAAVQLRRAGGALVRLVPSVAALEHLEPVDLDRLGTVQAAFRLLRTITE